MYKKLIERLRARAEIEQAGHACLLEVTFLLRGAADVIEKLQAERDAAVAQLTEAGLCDYCGHWSDEQKCGKHGKCEFVWNGGGTYGNSLLRCD